MSKKVIKIILSFISVVLIIFLVLLVFKADFYVNVYDEQNGAFLDMNYSDIKTSLNAQCVGTPGTGDSGYYIFEPVIAFPGFVTVSVEGYETKTVFGFLGFNNKIKIYMKKLK